MLDYIYLLLFIDPGVAYAHFLATHIFKIPNIVVHRPQPAVSTVGPRDTNSYLRRPSVLPMDNYSANSRMTYPGSSIYPDRTAAYDAAIAPRSSTAYPSPPSNNIHVQHTYNNMVYDTNLAMGGGFIGGIPVTPIQVYPHQPRTIIPTETMIVDNNNGIPTMTAPYMMPPPAAWLNSNNQENMNPASVSPPATSAMPIHTVPNAHYSPRRVEWSSFTRGGNPLNNNDNTALIQQQQYNNNNNILVSPSIGKPSSLSQEKNPNSVYDNTHTTPRPAHNSGLVSDVTSPYQTHRLLLQHIISGVYKRNRERILRRSLKQWYDNAHALTVKIQTQLQLRTTQQNQGISKLHAAMDKIALRQRMRIKHYAFVTWYTTILKLKSSEQSKELEDRARKEMEEKDRIQQLATAETIAKTKAETEKQKAESEKQKAEEAKRQAEQEKRKAEDEKRKAESEKQKAEDEKRKAEQEKQKAEDEKRHAEEAKRKIEEAKQKLEKEKLQVEQTKSALEKENVYSSKVAQEAELRATRLSHLFRLSLCGMITIFILLLIFISLLLPILLSSSNQNNDLWSQVITSYPWIGYLMNMQLNEDTKQRCLRILFFNTPICSNFGSLSSTNAAVEISSSIPNIIDNTNIPTQTYTINPEGDISTISTNNNNNMNTLPEDYDNYDDWCSSPFGTCGLENVAM